MFPCSRVPVFPCSRVPKGLKAYGLYVVDKIEGLAVTSDGEIFVSTDNNGVDDSFGETFFLSIVRTQQRINTL